MAYCIAYRDRDERSFSPTEPYIYDGVESLTDARNALKSLREQGVLDCTILSIPGYDSVHDYCEDPAHESITWDDVKKFSVA